MQHLLLGISNRIITKRFKTLFGKGALEKVLSTIKTNHKPGAGGRGDLFDLNGPEIKKWIKHKCSEKLVEITEDVSAEVLATHSILNRWLEQMNTYLVRKEWSGD